jgi:hypothetical protein
MLQVILNELLMHFGECMYIIYGIEMIMLTT